MEDRILELTKFANDSISLKEISAGSISNVFLKTVKFIQDGLNTVRKNNNQIKQLKEQHQTATLNEQESKISKALDRILTENNSVLARIREQMKELNKDVQASQNSSPEEPETRMKASSYQALTSKFQDILKESQAIQREFKSFVKEKMVRQVKLLDNTLSNQQVDEICSDHKGFSDFITRKIYGTSNSQIQNALADIQDKYRDILRLEENVKLVHQMFLDMAMLVQYQGEMLNNIESNVKASKNYIFDANSDLKKAKKAHLSARQKAFALMGCMAVLAIILFCIFLR